MHLTPTRLRYRTIDWRQLTGTLLGIAALVAGVLAWVVYSSAIRTEPVVIATANIAPGTRITADMLTVIQAPVGRPAALHGLPDPNLVIGTYARIQLSKDQVLRTDLTQSQPLGQHIYVNDPLPAEALTADVFELSLTGIRTVQAQDRVNILVLVDSEHGLDPEFRASQTDRAGSGARVVRTLVGLNVLHVSEQAAFLEVTHAQSQYLWALAAAKIPFVGEIATTADAPLGPLRAGDASHHFLGMGETPLQPTISPQMPTIRPTSGPASEDGELP